MEAEPKPESDQDQLKIKLNAKTRETLKKMAGEQGKSVEEVAAETLEVAADLGTLGLDAQKAKALTAYRGVWISIGRLAVEMDMNIVDLRYWLMDRGIPQNNDYDESELEHVLRAARKDSL